VTSDESVELQELSLDLHTSPLKLKCSLSIMHDLIKKYARRQ
jgi:hypothetical protein